MIRRIPYHSESNDMILNMIIDEKTYIREHQRNWSLVVEEGRER